MLVYCLQLDCIIMFMFGDVEVESKSRSLVFDVCSKFVLDANAHEKPVLPRKKISRMK